MAVLLWIACLGSWSGSECQTVTVILPKPEFCQLGPQIVMQWYATHGEWQVMAAPVCLPAYEV